MGGSSSRCCKDKQSVIWCRRAKEGEEIDHDLGGQLDRAHYMVHGLISIIALNEGISRKGFRAIFAPFLQAYYTCQPTMVVVHDEHSFLLHQSCSEYPVLPGSHLPRMS